MKLGYRCRLMKKVLSQIENCTTGQDVIRGINVKDAIDWIGGAWKDVRPETIQKCYGKAVFKGFDSFTDSEASGSERDNVFNELETMMTEVRDSLGLEIPSVDAYIQCDGEENVHAGDDNDWEADLLDKNSQTEDDADTEVRKL
jgi:hypothetical protein